MKKWLLQLTCLFLPILCHAQDTIFRKSNTPLIVRVLEISKDEVSYRQFFNPNNVVYKIASSNVLKIVYENGKEESRFQISQKTAAVVTNDLASEKFVVEDKHISYHNADITHKEAFKIMMKRDAKQNPDELNDALITAEGKKNGQIAFNIAAPVCAVGGLYLARRNYYTPKDAVKAKAFIISGLGLCVTSIVIGQIYKAQKNKAIRKAALAYNSDL
jgi:hypothetical protein